MVFEIPIRSADDLAAMERAGHVVATSHQRVEAAIAPGVTTAELDALVRETIHQMGATSNFYGHQGFPGYICASVNDVIVHGIPCERRLEDGDIISVDIGAIVDGFHGDSAWTYPVGKISDDAKRLLTGTEAALAAGLAQARAGNRLGAVGAAIETYARQHDLGIVQEYGGHGIGTEMWEEPHIPNHGHPNRGPLLKAGITLAIEPMLTLGGESIRTLRDKWTVVTRDGSWAAHFEHTIAVTDDAPILLTKRLPKVVE